MKDDDDESSSSSANGAPEKNGGDDANGHSHAFHGSLSCEDHDHGPDCGHEQVEHGDHFDYLVCLTCDSFSCL